MKIFLAAFCTGLFLFTANLSAQEVLPYRLSTHILDISRGVPAAGVDVELLKFTPETGKWEFQTAAKTESNGRISDLVPAGNYTNGIYKLQFKTAPYFKAQNLPSVYPYIEIVFEMTAEGHYHIPLTLSANGYATYKGN